MTPITFKIIPHGGPDYEAAVALREEMLRKPLGLRFHPAELEQEKAHIHIAGFQDDVLIATAVLVPQGEHSKMQRVVVSTAFQSTGVGSQMMQFCEAYAKAQGMLSIYCHARDIAVPFYLKNSYLPEGDYFEEQTIPHLKMRKML